MSTLRTLLCSAAFGCVIAFSGAARADGITVKSSALSSEALTKLETQIQSERAANPKAFEAVKKVKGHRPEVYRNYRNPYPTTTRELRGLGKAALFPILEALAVKAPERGSLNDAEWDALKIGMLEAVGVIGDARARPVVLATFEAPGLGESVQLAAGRAVGRLAGDAELALLTKHAVKGDALLLAAIAGLGEMRRVESAQHLASLLSTTKDADVAKAAAEALGVLGSSWAWRALGPKAEATGLAVRKVCAEALVPKLTRSQGQARIAVGDAILMVDHPTTVDLLKSERATAGKSVQAVDAVIARVERQRARMKR